MSKAQKERSRTQESQEEGRLALVALFDATEERGSLNADADATENRVGVLIANVETAVAKNARQVTIGGADDRGGDARGNGGGA